MQRQFLLLALVVFLAGAGWYWFQDTANAKEAPSSMAGGPSSQSVSVLPLTLSTIEINKELPGRISPFRQSQVRPQVNGIITERLFEEGVEVEKGQQLYQIDDARYKAALNSALADLKSARANIKSIKARVQRYKELVKIKAVSQQEYDDAKAELDKAEAAIAVAKAAVDVEQVNLDYTKVYAPISGRISRSFVTEGALVTANQAQHLAVITQLDPVYVDMQQSGSEAMALRARLVKKNEILVSLILDDKTNNIYPHKGILKFSEVTVDETTAAITLRALVPNSEALLLPGLFVRASLNLGEQDVLLLPQRATIRQAAGGLSVWIVDGESKARMKQIEVSGAYDDNWIVTNGLDVGDKVIVQGYQKVSEGMSVNGTPWKTTKTSPSGE